MLVYAAEIEPGHRGDPSSYYRNLIEKRYTFDATSASYNERHLAV
jgi:hypothetical protein